MKCQEFETLLNECLDQREDPRQHPALRDHADQCRSCESSLEIYAAIGEFGELSLTKSIAEKRRMSGYLTAAAAAALLFVLLGPLGNFFSNESGNVNLAHANTGGIGENETIGLQPSNGENQVQGSRFWQNRKFASMVPIEQIAYAVSQPPNLQEMGRSINTVLKTIQEDEFLIPIIKQGALLWIPR